MENSFTVRNQTARINRVEPKYQDRVWVKSNRIIL